MSDLQLREVLDAIQDARKDGKISVSEILRVGFLAIIAIGSIVNDILPLLT